MGYGGGNESMWTNNSSYFARVVLKDSVFGKQALHLKTVCWMNPYTAIEHIPADWTRVNIVIYHAYGKRFRMNNKFNVKLAPQSSLKDKEIPWVTLWSTSWPLAGHQNKPRGNLIRE